MKYKTEVHKDLTTKFRGGEAPDPRTTTDIDNLVNTLTKTIEKAHKLSVPTVKPSNYGLRLPVSTKTKIQERNRIRRAAQRSPAVRSTLMSQANNLQNDIRTDTNTIRNENFNNLLADIPSGGQRVKLWQVSKVLKNRGNNIPPLRHEGKTFISAEEKSNLIADQFASNFDNPLADNNKAHTKRILRSMKQYLNQPTEDFTTQVSLEELKIELK